MVKMILSDSAETQALYSYLKNNPLPILPTLPYLKQPLPLLLPQTPPSTPTTFSIAAWQIKVYIGIRATMLQNI